MRQSTLGPGARVRAAEGVIRAYESAEAQPAANAPAFRSIYGRADMRSSSPAMGGADDGQLEQRPGRVRRSNTPPENDYATGRIPLQAGYWVQPQNSFPAFCPFLAVRLTMAAAHLGQLGIEAPEGWAGG